MATAATKLPWRVVKPKGSRGEYNVCQKNSGMIVATCSRKENASFIVNICNKKFLAVGLENPELELPGDRTGRCMPTVARSKKVVGAVAAEVESGKLGERIKKALDLAQQGEKP